MIILGLNAFHGDSSACLVVDGELVAAAEEERFRRIKHWAGFPSEAVKYCLRAGGIGIDAAVAAPSQHWPWRVTAKAPLVMRPTTAQPPCTLKRPDSLTRGRSYTSTSTSPS